jgi:hypothetical protein
MSYIEDLEGAIFHLHKVESKHLSSVPVKEVLQGRTVWNGMVEVFEVMGHAETNRAYAWVHGEGDKGEQRRFVAVLHIPPVDSPEKAVRAAIVQGFNNAKT